MAVEDKEVLRYLALALTLVLLLWGCASRKPNPDNWRERGTIRLGSQGRKLGFKKMSSEIDRLLGTPYRCGGTTPEGLDCSGLVYLVYRGSFGLKLPSSSRELYRIGKPAGKRDLTYGDLVFFATSGSRVNHVGIYLGSGDFVHVSKSSGTIISNLKEDHYRGKYRGARRLLE